MTPTDPTTLDILSDSEIRLLIAAFALSRGERGFSEKEALRLLSLATSIRVQASLLGLALRGFASIDLDGEDDELAWGSLPDEEAARRKRILEGIARGEGFEDADFR